MSKLEEIEAGVWQDVKAEAASPEGLQDVPTSPKETFMLD